MNKNFSPSSTEECKENDILTRVKCECCKQTQFFRDNENIYIKCIRCKNERTIKISDIIYKSSELVVW